MTETQENLHFLDYWRVIRTRKEVIIAVFLLVVLAGIVITYTMPKVYRSSVLIQVKPESEQEVQVFPSRYVRYDPLFLRTQFEIIQSRNIVEAVVRDLGLTEKLGRGYGYLETAGNRSFEITCGIVTGGMEVQQYRDTNLIQVQMYLKEIDGDSRAAPELAARIADSIAEAFRGQREERHRSKIQSALDAMETRLAEQEKRVREAQEWVNEIRKEYKISVLGKGAGGEVTDLNASIRNLDSIRTNVRMELADKESKHKTVTGLKPEELRDAVMYVVDDRALASLVSRKRDVEIDLSRLRVNYGPKHPEVLTKTVELEELNEKIAEAISGLKNGIKAEYEAAREKLSILDSELEEKKQQLRLAESEGYRKFEEAQDELRRQKAVRDTLLARYEEERIDLGIPSRNIEIIESARVPRPDENVRPNKAINIALSVILGLALGIGMAYFVEYLDTSVKTIEEIEQYMGVPVLGVVPQKVKPFTDENSRTTHGEAYRVLRTNIIFSKKLKEKKALSVTSGSVGEGKSLTLFNLSCVCAELGDRVLMVDSDLHRPRLHKLLGVSRENGLANVLVGEVELEDAVRSTGISNLYFLPAGSLSGGTHGLMATIRMKEVVKRLREAYDMVLFDSPPIVGVSDASLLGREMDGILMVIQHRKYPKSVSTRARKTIEGVGGNLVGIVMNNINISKDYSYYYEQQTYHVYGKADRRRRKAERKG
ncbi:MAG: polysaccharide biosynthesis tyrosine autokinase [Kiritimatiellia bacterium]